MSDSDALANMQGTDRKTDIHIEGVIANMKRLGRCQGVGDDSGGCAYNT